jgi:hypothetical protein
MNVPRYPLAWPDGWPRKTPSGRRSAAFKVTYDRAVADLDNEIRLLGGRLPVLSTNLQLRLDGTPVRDRGEPSDRGVAVYFELNGKQKVFACETFTTVKDNIRAIGLTIEALRAMQRFGATEMLERTLNAFDALPPPAAKRNWWDTLECKQDASREVIEANYRRLARDRHPDRGGSNDAMAELNDAKRLALEARR